MNKKSMTFEASMTRLEEIVKQMEQGNVPLEQSLQLFEEGTALVKSCSELLKNAEMQVVRLMKGENDQPVEVEMELPDGV